MKIYNAYENAVFYGFIIPYDEMTTDMLIYISGLSEDAFYNLIPNYDEVISNDGFLNLFDLYEEDFDNKLKLVWVDKDCSFIGIGISYQLTKLIYNQPIFSEKCIKKYNSYINDFKQKFNLFDNDTYINKGVFLVKEY